MSPRVMTHTERAASYNAAFPKYPPLAVHGRWVYGIWEIGNNYKGSGYYGAYPPTYVKRVLSMFPDVPPETIVHLFSGKVDCPGIKVDIQASLGPTIVADATKLPFADASQRLVMADPPYSTADAKKYGPPLPDKRKVMLELARVVQPGGYVAWLDIPKPMYRKAQWTLWGEIGVLRSTNHRGRFLFLFQRTTEP